MGVFVLGLLCSQFMSNIWFSHNYLQENTFDHGCNVIGFDKRIIILMCAPFLWSWLRGTDIYPDATPWSHKPSYGDWWPKNATKTTFWTGRELWWFMRIPIFTAFSLVCIFLYPRWCGHESPKAIFLYRSGLTLILTPIAAFDGLVRPALILLWALSFLLPMHL